MINVTIAINDRVIYSRSARNISPIAGPEDKCRYKVDTGKTILHKRSDGAVALARKMLDTIEEI